MGMGLRAKLGIYVPMYGGWLRDCPVEEKEVSYSYAKQVVLKAEEVGIDSVWVPDHMLNPIKGEQSASLEAWTTMTALAASTEKVELFNTCLCQGFRHPSVLAKMATTLSEISNGRFRLVIGAGWMKREFDAYGLHWDQHDVLIDRGREQVEIIVGLWTEARFNYRGRFFAVDDGVMEPKPTTVPEIWWAGDSEKSRELTADLAQGWLAPGGTPEEMRQRIKDMQRRLEKRGISKKSMRYAMPENLFVGKTDEEAKERVKSLTGGSAAILDSILRTGFVGSAETVIGRIKEFDKIRLDYIIFQISPALDMLEELNRQVIPNL